MKQLNEQQLREIIKEEISKVLHLNEMARVGIMNGRYDVVIYTDDAGYIPHVHVIDCGTRGMSFDCCVKLTDNTYFSHGRHKDVMPSGMKREFHDFMLQPSKAPQFKNNYHLAASLWNLNNSNSTVQIREDEDGNVIVPDYTKLH